MWVITTLPIASNSFSLDFRKALSDRILIFCPKLNSNFSRANKTFEQNKMQKKLRMRKNETLNFSNKIVGTADQNILAF